MKVLKILFFFIILNLVISTNTYTFSIGVFNFFDKSGYRGKWRITSSIPKLLVEKLNKSGYKSFYINKSISPDKSKIKKTLSMYTNLIKCDIYIIGNILDFSVSQIGLLSVGLGGYNRYAGETKIKYYIISMGTNNKIDKITLHKKVVDNNIGISFLGGPGVDDIDETLYERLNKISFGSDKFFKTVIGRALNYNIKNFIKKLKKNFAPDINKTHPKIVQVENNKYVYINIGLDNNVKKGDKYIIYREGKNIYDPVTHILLGKSIIEIAVIQVDFIISDKLSKAKIIKWINKEKLIVGSKIKKM